MYNKPEHIVTEIVGDVTIIFNEQSERFYSFTGLEKEIWGLIDLYSTNEIVELICREYDVDFQQAQKDLISFCKSLEISGLICK